MQAQLAYFSRKLTSPQGRLFSALGASLCAFLMQRWCCWAGLMRTHDSKYYEATAQNVGLHNLWHDHLGQLYTNWPPLYPFLLSFFPLNIPLWASWLQALALFGTVLGFCYLMPPQKSSGILLRLLGAAFCPFLMLCAVFLWSEMLFLCASVWAFVGIERFLSADLDSFEEKKCFWATVLCLNLACLSRHAGIFWILAGSIVLFERLGFKKTALWLVASSFSFACWQVRTVFFVENAKDYRQAMGAVSLQESALSYTETLGSWLSAESLPCVFKVILGLAFLVFFVVLLYRTWAALWVRRWACLVLMYVLGLLLLRMNIASESERYLLPIWLLVLPLWQIANSEMKTVTSFDIFLRQLSRILLVLVLFLLAAKCCKALWFWGSLG